MTLSGAERKRRFDERQRELARKRPDASYEFLKVPFHEWAANDPNLSSFDIPLALAGMEAPSFEDDRGAEYFVDSNCYDTEEQLMDIVEGLKGSVGRAEMMVGCLLDASSELASMINRYKLAELENRATEIETTDLSDPEKRKEALDQVVKIRQIQDALSKTVRHSLQQWRVPKP